MENHEVLKKYIIEVGADTSEVMDSLSKLNNDIKKKLKNTDLGAGVRSDLEQISQAIIRMEKTGEKNINELGNLIKNIGASQLKNDLEGAIGVIAERTEGLTTQLLQVQSVLSALDDIGFGKLEGSIANMAQSVQDGILTMKNSLSDVKQLIADIQSGSIQVVSSNEAMLQGGDIQKQVDSQMSAYKKAIKQSYKDILKIIDDVSGEGVPFDDFFDIEFFDENAEAMTKQQLLKMNAVVSDIINNITELKALAKQSSEPINLSSLFTIEGISSGADLGVIKRIRTQVREAIRERESGLAQAIESEQSIKKPLSMRFRLELDEEDTANHIATMINTRLSAAEKKLHHLKLPFDLKEPKGTIKDQVIGLNNWLKSDEGIGIEIPIRTQKLKPQEVSDEIDKLQRDLNAVSSDNGFILNGGNVAISNDGSVATETTLSRIRDILESWNGGIPITTGTPSTSSQSSKFDQIAFQQNEDFVKRFKFRQKSYNGSAEKIGQARVTEAWLARDRYNAAQEDILKADKRTISRWKKNEKILEQLSKGDITPITQLKLYNSGMTPDPKNGKVYAQYGNPGVLLTDFQKQLAQEILSAFNDGTLWDISAQKAQPFKQGFLSKELHSVAQQAENLRKHKNGLQNNKESIDSFIKILNEGTGSLSKGVVPNRAKRSLYYRSLSSGEQNNLEQQVLAEYANGALNTEDSFLNKAISEIEANIKQYDSLIKLEEMRQERIEQLIANRSESQTLEEDSSAFFQTDYFKGFVERNGNKYAKYAPEILLSEWQKRLTEEIAAWAKDDNGNPIFLDIEKIDKKPGQKGYMSKRLAQVQKIRKKTREDLSLNSVVLDKDGNIAYSEGTVLSPNEIRSKTVNEVKKITDGAVEELETQREITNELRTQRSIMQEIVKIEDEGGDLERQAALIRDLTDRTQIISDNETFDALTKEREGLLNKSTTKGLTTVEYNRLHQLDSEIEKLFVNAADDMIEYVRSQLAVGSNGLSVMDRRIKESESVENKIIRAGRGNIAKQYSENLLNIRNDKQYHYMQSLLSKQESELTTLANMIRMGSDGKADYSAMTPFEAKRHKALVGSTRHIREELYGYEQQQRIIGREITSQSKRRAPKYRLKINGLSKQSELALGKIVGGGSPLERMVLGMSDADLQKTVEVAEKAMSELNDTSPLSDADIQKLARRRVEKDRKRLSKQYDAMLQDPKSRARDKNELAHSIALLDPDYSTKERKQKDLSDLKSKLKGYESEIEKELAHGNEANTERINNISETVVHTKALIRDIEEFLASYDDVSDKAQNIYHNRIKEYAAQIKANQGDVSSIERILQIVKKEQSDRVQEKRKAQEQTEADGVQNKSIKEATQSVQIPTFTKKEFIAELCNELGLSKVTAEDIFQSQNFKKVNKRYQIPVSDARDLIESLRIEKLQSTNDETTAINNYVSGFLRSKGETVAHDDSLLKNPIQGTVSKSIVSQLQKSENALRTIGEFSAKSQQLISNLQLWSEDIIPSKLFDEIPDVLKLAQKISPALKKEYEGIFKGLTGENRADFEPHSKMSGILDKMYSSMIEKYISSTYKYFSQGGDVSSLNEDFLKEIFMPYISRYSQDAFFALYKVTRGENSSDGAVSNADTYVDTSSDEEKAKRRQALKDAEKQRRKELEQQAELEERITRRRLGLDEEEVASEERKAKKTKETTEAIKEQQKAKEDLVDVVTDGQQKVTASSEDAVIQPEISSTVNVGEVLDSSGLALESTQKEVLGVLKNGIKISDLPNGRDGGSNESTGKNDGSSNTSDKPSNGSHGQNSGNNKAQSQKEANIIARWKEIESKQSVYGNLGLGDQFNEAATAVENLSKSTNESKENINELARIAKEKTDTLVRFAKAGKLIGKGFSGLDNAQQFAIANASEQGTVISEGKFSNYNPNTGIASMTVKIRDANKEVKTLKYTYENGFLSMADVTKRLETSLTGFPAIVGHLQSKLKQLITYWTANYLNPYDLIRYIRQGVEIIHELDAALVDLRKTTTMTSSQLNDFYYDSNKVAKQLGVTTKEIIQQAANWSRLGYSSKEAATEMATLSSQFAQISPGMNLDNATDGLVSTMKAFHIDVADVERDVMDSINRIGNTFATSNDEIVNMLTRSSAAMAAANNTLAETVGLESAAVQITRNAETTGTAFRTISMRIRGYDEETEELSDDLRNISGDIADLTKTTKNPHGVSLFTDATNKTYKSTYQILKDIAAVYHDLDDKQQASLLEKLAGKRGGQVLAGVLDDFSEVDRAMKEIENSAGSADAEMSIIRDSIDYKLNNLSQIWVGFTQDTLSQDALKGILDFLSAVSEGLSGILGIVQNISSLGGNLSSGGLLGDIGLVSGIVMNHMGMGEHSSKQILYCARPLKVMLYAA